MPHILVVDHDPVALESTAGILSRAGFAIVPARTGRDALTAIHQHRPALVLLNVVLPDASGFEVLGRIRANPGLAATAVILADRRPNETVYPTLEPDTAGTGVINLPLEEPALLERVRAALRQRERQQVPMNGPPLTLQLTDTLEALPDAFCILDREWRCIYLNAAAERLLQRPRSHVLQTVFWHALASTPGAVCEEEIRRAWTENAAVQREFFHPSLDQWFEVRAHPSAQGLAVSFRDVTAVRSARESLRENEERFRQLAQATNDAFWDWDLQTGVVWRNERFETLFGYAPGEIEPTIEWWKAHVHADDRERVLRRFQLIVENGGTYWADEYRFIRRDGTHAYVLDRGHVLHDAQGRPIRMAGGMTDFTVRRAAEEQLAQQAALLDKAQDAILVRDSAHHITYWNKRAERLYGWTAAEAVGRSARELLYREPAAFDSAMEALLRQGEWVGELPQQDKHGRPLTVEGHWTLVQNDPVLPPAVLCINTDITERKVLEAQFRRAQRMESLGTLAGGIAHGLNNLLAPILMGVGLLRMQDPRPESGQVIDHIERSARRGSNLLKQVLAFARGIEGAREALDLAQIVAEIETIVQNTFPRQIAIRVDLPAELWPVSGDATQLNQVLLNLCVNARDAMPEGGQISLSGRNVVVDRQNAARHGAVPPGSYVMLECADDGSGMPRDVLDRAFEPFFTTKELGKGTGLGLSTVLGIIRSHGGHVQVESEPGQGSVFKIYLPATNNATPAPVPVAVDDGPRKGCGETILLVDDEEPIRRMTGQMLEAYGYRVLAAGDGAAALRLYEQHRKEIAVVISDMMMPNMDGPALIAALRAQDPGVRLIAASGFHTASQNRKIEHHGVKHFLAKPYTPALLLATIKTAMAAELPGRNPAPASAPAIQPAGTENDNPRQ